MEENPFDIRVLDPRAVRLFRVHPGDARVRLTLNDDRSWREVRIARAFPFSEPDRYIGLRDGADKDIGLIENPGLLDEESCAVIEQELARRYFTPQIQRVVSVKEEMGTVTWEVETDRGARRFVVRNLRDSTFPLGPNRLMMTDTDGNRYEFPDVTALGGKAYQVLVKVL
ncbi:MAG: DUF1854 domain-containing protein [Armatimonadetes bacterium]|nr:DUF1854 domain-containing protein [Armatimonadota bacterium]